jgi:hypothetical protein
MSTSPETREQHEDDRLVSVLSHWLARHVGDDELRRELAEADQTQLSPDQVEAVEELLADLMSDQGRGELERSVRETLEALALR